MRYKVRRQGKNLGEFTWDELTRRRAAGEFSGAEYVQLEGTSDWQPLDLVIEGGYRTELPTPPPLATSGLPSQTIIWSAILTGIIGMVTFLVFFERLIYRVQHTVVRSHSASYYNSSHTPPVPAAVQPVVWTTNTATVADATRRAREFRLRQWLDGYERRGQRNPEYDKEAVEFLETWIGSNYGGSAATNGFSLTGESDKLAADPQCTDPLLLTVAGDNNVNRYQAKHCFERALAAYPQSQYLAYPQLYATERLIAQLDPDDARVNELEVSAPALIAKCFVDGSFTPADQQELGEIFVPGWARNLFQHNSTSICSIVRMAGTNYQWLALTLDGEREIAEAWAARGGGYSDSVTSHGWQGFRSHLANARTDLTTAWNQQPMWPLAPERMIYVSLGDSDINEMRRWFDLTTTAQIDYNQAWSDFRWGLRPRWYGNEASLLAVGVAAVNTGRFDTDVPRKYIDAIYDVESELDEPAGEHIFGRNDVWPNLQRMYEGYLAAPSQEPCRDGWRTSYAVVAYFAGKFDVARTQLAALNWKPVPENLTGWGVDLSQMPMEVAARTGKDQLKVSAAEWLAQSDSFGDAIKDYRELAGADPDPLTSRFIQLRLRQLGMAQQLKNGAWVDWLPADNRDPNWVFPVGRASRLPDGGLEVESGTSGHMLYSQTPVGENFEVRGQFENVRSANKNFQGGLVMGVPDVDGYNWYGFRVKRHDEEGDVVCFSEGWTVHQLVKPATLYDVTNTFDLVFQSGKVTASVNGIKIFQQATAPRKIRVPNRSYLVGLGAFSDSADSAVRYRDVQLRRLD